MEDREAETTPHLLAPTSMFSPSAAIQLTVQKSMKSTREYTILMGKILKNTSSPGQSYRGFQSLYRPLIAALSLLRPITFEHLLYII